MAARIPAPPAPMMITSYLWNCSVVGSPRGSVRDVRVEGEDHERAERDDQHHRDVEQHLQPEPGGVLARVVVDDRPHAVAAVDLREPEHREVPELPEGRRPPAGDEAEVDLVDTAVEDVHDEQV